MSGNNNKVNIQPERAVGISFRSALGHNMSCATAARVDELQQSIWAELSTANTGRTSWSACRGILH